MLGVRRFVLDRVGDPVLEWELLQRRRRRGKAYVAITRIVYGLYSLFVFMSIAFVLFVDSMPSYSHQSNFRLNRLQAISESLLVFSAFWLPVCTVFLVVPAFGASSIVGERRSQTLGLVQLSLLRPFDIVWGKVVASVTPILGPVVVSAFAFMPVTLLSSSSGNAIYRRFVDSTSYSHPNAIYQLARDDEYWFLLVGNAGFLAVVVLAMAVVFTVSALSVLISTFARSSAVAVTVSYGMTFMLFLYLNWLTPQRYVPTVYDNDPLQPATIMIVLYYVVVSAVLWYTARLFVWWACKRLRLPVVLPVVDISKSSAAAIPVSLVVAFTLLLLLNIPVLTAFALTINIW